jgi:hypothetical protein
MAAHPLGEAALAEVPRAGVGGCGGQYDGTGDEAGSEQTTA